MEVCMVKRDPVREFLRKIGAKGGKRCLETMTPEQRSARAKTAVTAREVKRQESAKSGFTA